MVREQLDTAEIAIEVASNDGTFPIRGFCRPEFARVLQAFGENFEKGEEVGASVAVTHNGQTVVDLWGGYRDSRRTVPWERDTIVNTMSITKAMSATCLHVLADRRLIDLDAPVATYWPEFAQAGKQDLPVRYVLDHRAGLPVIDAPLPRGAIFDWEAMTSALAAQRPLWEPGTASGYHIRTQGFLIGEIVRRVTGVTLGQFFRREIAEPFGIDFQVGLPSEDFGRCAEFIPAVAGTILNLASMDPESLLFRASKQLPAPLDYNTKEWRSSELPSSNGHGNARAIARFYTLLVQGGILDGKRLLSEASVDRALSEQHAFTERVMGRVYHQTLGFVLNSPPIVPMGPNDRAFGHHGVGGSLGMADREAGVAFGYAMNRMHALLENGPRAGRLVAAVFASA